MSRTEITLNTIVCFFQSPVHIVVVCALPARPEPLAVRQLDVSYQFEPRCPAVHTAACLIGEGAGVVRKKREIRGCTGILADFSLGDRACCHGAGPPIGGVPGQSFNSTDCFIIEKFSSLPVSPTAPCFSPSSSLQRKLINYTRFVMSAQAVSQIPSDTLLHFTPVAEVHFAESGTYLHTVQL